MLSFVILYNLLIKDLLHNTGTIFFFHSFIFILNLTTVHVPCGQNAVSVCDNRISLKKLVVQLLTWVLSFSLQDSLQFQTVYSSFIFKLFGRVHFVELKGPGREGRVEVYGACPNILMSCHCFINTLCSCQKLKENVQKMLVVPCTVPTFWAMSLIVIYLGKASTIKK